MTSPSPQPHHTQLPSKALATTATSPWPVRVLSEKIKGYIDKMPPVWVEGQVVQFNLRPRSGMQWLTLRDTDVDMSLPVTIYSRVLSTMSPPPVEGDHVVVHAKPVFWTKRGEFQMQAKEIKAVGIGELLARIEALKKILAAEGLFDASRKRPLPFLPAVVGLVCGRESKAEHDVVVNARARWPHIRFDIREVAVQGVQAVREVSHAIKELDQDPRVEVIVVARGGGSVEDLLSFSNEAMVRTVAQINTPLVSAIGHETDAPLLDLVADYRASTPTDAAKRIVPDVSEERHRLDQARHRIRGAVTAMLEREQHKLDGVQSRPVLSAPHTMVESRERDTALTIRHARHSLDALLLRASGDIGRLSAQVKALSPASTLERGYAVVQREDGAVVRQPADVTVDSSVRIRLIQGELNAKVISVDG